MNKVRLSFSFVLISMLMYLFISSLNAQDLLKTLSKRHTAYKNSAPKERILVITDRNIYAPGDVIWFNAIAFDIFTSKISHESDQLTLRLYDQENNELYNKIFKIANGTVNGFIQLPDGIQEGVYYLTSETEHSMQVDYLYHKLVVKAKIVPQFIIEANFKERNYLPGDVIEINLSFKDVYNEPMRKVNYQIDFFEGKTRIPGKMGKVKKGELVTVNAKVPNKLTSGLFTYRVTAESKVAEATLEGKFPVQSDKIFIEFYPENGKIINGIKSKVNLFSYDALGWPLAVELDIMEDEKVINTVRTDQRGIGSFYLDPNDVKKYAAKVKKPILLDKKHKLPKVTAKGIALRVNEKSSRKVNYKLLSSYSNPREVVLVGVAGGRIFWVSEHEVDKELDVSIDLTNTDSPIAHFIALNAAARIEGEHILVIPWETATSIELKETSISTTTRGLVTLEFETPDDTSGEIIVTAVNDPWISEELSFQPIYTVLLPFDIQEQLVFQSPEFRQVGYNYERLEEYLQYYIPYGFGWDRILSTPGAFEHKELQDLVLANRIKNEQIFTKCKVVKFDGMISHVNMISDRYFATSNPKFVSKLYAVKREQVPSYKKLLENGTSLKEVIMTIKPYSLQGSKIVFMGSANSINFQGGALIVIDGVNRGTDAGLLDNISPFDVENINVSTNPSDIQRYTGLNSVGLIEIELKKGKDESKNTMDPMDENTEFVSPEYTNGKGGHDTDFRKTLFWKAESIGAKTSTSTITYYNSDLISNVKGRIYFIPNHGLPSSTRFEYRIKLKSRD